MATSGDRYLATSGDFFMATDTLDDPLTFDRVGSIFLLAKRGKHEQSRHGRSIGLLGIDPSSGTSRITGTGRARRTVCRSAGDLYACTLRAGAGGVI
jgi:hypothetical protein